MVRPTNPHDYVKPDGSSSRTKTYAYFLQILLPHLPELFPSTVAQKGAFGPGAYLLRGDAAEKEGSEMERREAEVWGFAAA